MRSFVAFALASSFVVLLPATRAAAAEPVADAAIADVVETRDGLVVRGTILERDPSGTVVIRSATGALRTFKMSEVVYAGPASRWAQAAPPPPVTPAPALEAAPRAQAIGGETVPVELESGNRDVSFHLRNATAYSGSHAAIGYTPLCSAPCKAHLPRGVVHLGVAEGNGLPREGSEVLRIDGPSRVRADVASATGRRVLGGVMFLGGLAIAATAPMWTMTERQNCKYGPCVTETDIDTTKLLVGALGGAALVSIGGYMLFAPASITFTVTPLSISPAPGLTPDARRVFAPSGAALEVRF
jgi:hypothetical protein